MRYGRKLAPPALAVALLLALGGCGGGQKAASEHDAAGQTMDHGAMGHASHTSMAATAAMPGMPGMVMSDGDGLSATVGGYTLAAVKGPAQAGKPGLLSFEIRDRSGQVQKEYVRAQAKLMHVYLVRHDLTGYQHLHPTMDPATGVWSVRVRIPAAGHYRLLTEFEALRPDHLDSDARKLGADLTVPGEHDPGKFVAAPGPRGIDGYRVELDGTPRVGGGTLTLRITRGGDDVTDLQPYLESFAHVTGFREGDLKAVHVHPDEKPETPAALGGPDLTLAPMFAEPGTYRLFVEFMAGDRLHLVPLDVEVP